MFAYKPDTNTQKSLREEFEIKLMQTLAYIWLGFSINLHIFSNSLSCSQQVIFKHRQPFSIFLRPDASVPLTVSNFLFTIVSWALKQISGSVYDYELPLHVPHL